MAVHTSLFAVRALACGAVFMALSLASPAGAVSCKEDSGGGCERDGLACSPSSDAPPAAGKCTTVTQERVLKCLCLKTPPAKISVSRVPYVAPKGPSTREVLPSSGHSTTSSKPVG